MVLVRPARGGNVGAVCRAMKNMGLSRLVLVDPGEVGGEEARSQAWQAWDILEGARQEPTLRAAPTPRELQVLRGLARQVAWAAGEIGRSGARKG